MDNREIPSQWSLANTVIRIRGSIWIVVEFMPCFHNSTHLSGVLKPEMGCR